MVRDQPSVRHRQHRVGPAGDNRTFSSTATCADRRACISVDFQAGTVRLEVNTSCDKGKTHCVAPPSYNYMNVTGSADSLKLDYHLLNPKAPGNVPATDGTWRFSEAQYTGPCATTVGGTCPSEPGVKTSFDGDSYPSWEVYHYSQNLGSYSRTDAEMRSVANSSASCPFFDELQDAGYYWWSFEPPGENRSYVWC
jgi:hypothetical protein